ncbi:hypothetical protein [Nocardioides insulae]|uniref:hypothetical protein n=1 Tax=Nocardioides insulae TaxID=394734 RepID=UPI000427A860|nr:hypothetical protein [Nocardioides insulae]
MKKTMRTIASALATALVVGMMSFALTTTTASPAQAAVTVPTGWVNVKYTGGVRTHGSVFRVVGNWVWAYEDQGGGVPVGSVYLQFRPSGSAAWKNVAVDRTPNNFDLRQRVNLPGVHRLYYTGGRDAKGTYYARRATGAFASMPVKRKITVKLKKRAFKVSGKVSPNYKRKPVFLVKVKGPKATKGRKVAKVRTNRHGRYTVKLPKRSRTTYYRLWTPRKGDYVRGFSDKWIKTWRTYRRPVAGAGGSADVLQSGGATTSSLAEWRVESPVAGRRLSGSVAPTTLR